jgi:hypothetical protein
MIEEADHSSQDGQQNHSNEICHNGHDLLEPDDKGRTAGTRNHSGLPELAKAWKTGS